MSLQSNFFSVLLVIAMVATAATLPVAYGQKAASVAADENHDPWLSFPGAKDTKLPGSGKKIVLISGDEEYRSEEALPLMADILSKQHGFECVVLFAINPETNSVDPNYQANIPGLHHLDDADAMIMFLRFRGLPDSQMAFIDRFMKGGKPFIALRTSTHPFNFPEGIETSYRHWSFNSSQWPGGFGQQVIGETWHSHHGIHKSQATRGIVAEGAKSNPILRGVSDVFGPSDVYGVVHLPPSASVLMYGQVLSGMKPTDPPLEGEKNEPMMPLVWTKEYQLEGGKPGKLFCTTMGSSVDFLNEGLRRMIVNATYWSVGLEDKIPAKGEVVIPASYEPTFFGFQDKDYFKNKKLRVTDFLVK